MVRQNGELVQWNDERGFGFIAGDDGQRSFVHVSDIGRIATRPRAGDRVSFTLGRGTDGRTAAKDRLPVPIRSTPRQTGGVLRRLQHPVPACGAP